MNINEKAPGNHLNKRFQLSRCVLFALFFPTFFDSLILRQESPIIKMNYHKPAEPKPKVLFSKTTILAFSSLSCSYMYLIREIQVAGRFFQPQE